LVILQGWRFTRRLYVLSRANRTRAALELRERVRAMERQAGARSPQHGAHGD